MRTCTTLLGSDTALRNPRARVGWGWGKAGAHLCSPWAPATSSHQAGLSGTHCRGAVGQESSGQPRLLAEQDVVSRAVLLPPCLPPSWAD